MTPEWLIVTDFDGTLTENDLGNELALEADPLRFETCYRRYRSGEWTLHHYLTQLWTGFPLTETMIRERARQKVRFRPGIREFFRFCGRNNIPLFIASCGLELAIESALETLGLEERQAVSGLLANKLRFDQSGIAEFLPPHPATVSPYPLDKGLWCAELKAQFPNRLCFGIGNGTADQTFWPVCDRLAARDKLALWCEQKKIPYIPFETLHDLLKVADLT